MDHSNQGCHNDKQSSTCCDDQSSPHIFQGIHILGEIYGCKEAHLNDVALLEKLLKEGIEKSGATLCSVQSKKFDPAGVTVLALLSESHASIHTYPENGALFFDAFTCGTACDPEEIAKALFEGLDAQEHSLQKIMRGAAEDCSDDEDSEEHEESEGGCCGGGRCHS